MADKKDTTGAGGAGGRGYFGNKRMITFGSGSSRLPVTEDSSRGRSGIGRGGRAPAPTGAPPDPPTRGISGIGRGNQGATSKAAAEMAKPKSPGVGGCPSTPRPTRLNLGMGMNTKDGGRNKGSGLPRLTTTNTTVTTSIPGRKPSGLRQPSGEKNTQSSEEAVRKASGISGISSSVANTQRVIPKPSEDPGIRSKPSRGNAPEASLNSDNQQGGNRIPGYDGKAIPRPSALPVDPNRGSSNNASLSSGSTRTDALGGGQGQTQRSRSKIATLGSSSTGGSGIPTKSSTSRVPQPGGNNPSSGGQGSGMPNRRRTRLGSSGSSSSAVENSRKPSSKAPMSISPSKPTSPLSGTTLKSPTYEKGHQRRDVNTGQSKSPVSPDSSVRKVPPRPPRLIPRRIPGPSRGSDISGSHNVSKGRGDTSSKDSNVGSSQQRGKCTNNERSDLKDTEQINRQEKVYANDMESCYKENDSVIVKSASSRIQNESYNYQSDCVKNGSKSKDTDRYDRHSEVTNGSSRTCNKQNESSTGITGQGNCRKPPLAPRTSSIKPPQNVSPTRKKFSSSLSLSSSNYSMRNMGRMSSEDEGSQCTSPDAALSSSASVCGSELSDISAPYSDISIPSPVKLKGHVLLDWDTDSYASTSVGASPDCFLEEYTTYESDWKTDSFISQHADSGWYTDSCFSPNSPKENLLPEMLGGESSKHNLFLRLNSNSSVDSKRSSRISVDSFMLPPSPSEDENGVLRIDSEHLLMIYTDWANHYLEKARNKRVITDLQVDICDGVILAEVIEAVTNERVRDIKTKPRNSQQMVENISQCLTFLAGLGVNVEGLSAKDIKDGNLKAILGLFFSLSRFKQQQKSAQQQVQHNINQNTVTPTSDSGRSSTGSASNANANTEMLSRLPSPFSSKGSNKCPTVTHPGVTKDTAPTNQNLNKNRTPASATTPTDRVRAPAPQNNNNPPASRRSQELKSRPVLTKGGNSNIPSKATSRESVSTSRSTSPSSSVSNIPTPGGRSGLRAPGTLSEKHSASGRLVSSTSTSSCASTASGASSSTKSSSAAASKSGLGAGANNKNSMLDKFKFFKGDKKSGVPKSSSSKKGSAADKDAEKAGQAASTSAVPEAKGGVGTSSRIASPKSEPNGASEGGSPKLSSKSSTKKSFGLKKKDSSVSKDDLNSKRGIPSSTSSNLQAGSLAVNGTSSSSGAKRSSSSSSKAEKAEAAASVKGSSSSSSYQNGGQGSPQTTRKTSKIASLAGKSSSKSSKNGVSSGSQSSALPVGSGIPAPSTGIPKPNSRSSSKPPKDEGKAKVPTSSSSSKEKGFQNSGPPSAAHHAQLKMASSQSRSESPKPPPRTTSQLSSVEASSPQADYDRSESSLRRIKASNQVQLDDLAQVQKHVKAAAMAAARSQQSSPVADATQHKSSSSSTMHSSQSTPSEQEPRKSSKPKPLKVDSDTQTHASAVAVAHARMREVGKEKSSQSLSSEGSANVSSGENSKSSTSNSNNSVSSNDSVIFRPSSCDELESGLDSDSNMSAKPTDHISSLRKQTLSSPGSPGGQRSDTKKGSNSPAPTKMETTFDTEGHTETRDVEQKPSKETTFGDEQEEVIDIKPMMPITRATPYAYLKSLTPGVLPRPSFHMSNTITPSMNSASSRLGVNRPLIDHNSYSKIKRTMSSHDHEMSPHIVDGYMSDGDVLHSTHHHPSEDNSGYFSDVNSGYMSEGGATLYAKKMQQRFREGMAAVKECMQKSAGLPDDDRYVRQVLQYPSDHSGFDDSSSISSGEISDTINEISTDENLTNSSLSAGSEHTTNPYGSLRRAPQPHHPFSHQNKFGLLKSGNGLLDRSLSRDTGDFSLRKYLISGDRIPSDARSDGALERGHWGMDRNGGPHPIYRTIDIPPAGSLLRKGSQGTVTDPRTGQQWQHGTAYAVEDPSLKNTYSEPASTGGKEKKDSETNTDHTLMLRKGQAGRPPQGGFGLRRPLSNVSTGSTGSSKSGSSIRGPQIGMKLTEKEKAQQKGERLANYTGSTRNVQKTASGTQTGGYHGGRGEPSTDMGPEAYSESTLERKKRSAGLVTSKSQTTVCVNAGQAPAPGGPDDYRSSTLGRKRPDMAIRDRLFGSRSSLNGKSPAVTSDGGQNIVNGTIISNPHATYSKQDSSPYRHNTYSGPGSTSSTSPVGASPYVNVTYMASDYLNNRPSSAMSNPTSPSNSPWIKSAPASLHNGAMRGTLSETESMESISSSASSSIQAQIQQARAHGLLSRSILQHEKDIQTGHIQRSDSFRSTQSEKMFPSTSQPDGLQRTNSFSQISGHPPPSPTPSNSSHASSRYTYPGMTPISPTSGAMSLVHATSTTSQSMPYGLGLKINSKDEDLHGSALSLVSSSSSVYSTTDERAAAEIRILGQHPQGHHQNALTMHNLSQRAHVVAAFEQSLSNMTTRLQQLTTTAEQKDSELNELRATIEALKQQSGIQFSPEHSFSPGSHRRPSSSNTSTLSREPSTPGEPPRISRHMSSDSMSSINSLSSACSATSQQSSATDTDSAKKNKKKGKSWLRSSFSKAFSRKKNKHGSVSDVEPDTASLRSECSVPNSPLLQPHNNGAAQNSSMKGSHSSHAICDPVEHDKAVMQLQVALHEKDMKLTDIRLEALSSAHQLEQLRETMNRMKNEMASLKADNSRLQQLVSKKGLTHPEPIAAGPTSPTTLEKRLSLEAPSNLELLLSDNVDREGRRITISVSMTSEVSKLSEGKPGEVLIGAISVSGKTKWEMLDVIVRRVFKEYVLRIDPVTNLGLTTESVNYYSIGDLIRSKDVSLPELLPCGYLVGDSTNITLTLKGTIEHSVESLAFETLIPKSIVQRYISLLLEHRRIILCGPSGTGKSYLAQKLAEYLVLKSGKELTAGLIATFNVDHKSSKELRQYLANIADQCESTTAGELPSVIILDNLHHVTSLGEVFNGFLSVKYQKCPYIIGTMNQATCSTTNLQLHHNFRWVLCANHMEPVKGFLGRYLRRKLIEAEIQTRARNNDLVKIADWMPKVWQHLNKFLETHSSSDVTIGPRLFLSCPMDVPGSQVWFTDLWNYSIVPYLLEAVREGLQVNVYGRRAPWEDPADWVIETYPWPHSNDQDWPSLLRLRPEDVGYDSQGAPAKGEKAQGQGAQQSDSEGDPLLNMLMRLQEAASYSSPQSADSDSTSLDSHSSGVQEFNTSGSGSASTESAS